MAYNIYSLPDVKSVLRETCPPILPRRTDMLLSTD